MRCTVYKNLKVADNAIGYTHASGNSGRSAFTSRVVDSLFVGETENIGNPKDASGNGLRPQLRSRARTRGFPDPRLRVLVADYHHELDNVTFVNFQDNATRKTGARSLTCCIPAFRE